MTLRSMWVLTGSNSCHNRVAYFGRSNRVCAMDVQGSVLDASLFRGNKCFDILGCFVVEFV